MKARRLAVLLVAALALVAAGCGGSSDEASSDTDTVAVETVVAATAEDGPRLAAETADLLYHLLVLLQARGVPLEQVWSELERRER